MMIVTIFLISIAIALVHHFFKIKSKNYPPGPPWLPLFGNQILIRNLARHYGSLSRSLAALAKYYNTRVLGLYLTGDYTVIVFGEKLVKKVFLAKEFQSRPSNFFSRMRSLGTNKGITMTDGHLWHEQRTFLLQHLSELGFGSTIMENLIEEEFKSLLRDIGSGGTSVDMGHLFGQRALNVLWTMIAGKSIAGDSRMLLIRKLMNERTRAFDMSGGTLASMPWLRFISPVASGYSLINKINDQLHQLVTSTINEHKRTYKAEVTRDYIDTFLHEMYKNKDNKDTTFTDDQLMMMCLDLIIASLQTTTHTLEFAVLRMANHPDVQARVQSELDSVLKPGQIPVFADRFRLPYTVATISEVMRANYVIPLTGPRKTTRDTTLDGYFIPRGTTVLTEMMSVINDENKTKNPELFLPERFLNSENNDLQYYPFSYGKRRCPGEVLARNMIFVFVAGLLHHYIIYPEKGKPPPSLEPVPGITNSPQPYRIYLMPRHMNDCDPINPYFK